MKEAFGGLSSDWKEGINWAAMRPWRLNRAREAIKRYGLGALLLMYDEKVGGRAEACGVEPARARPRRAGAARAGPGSRRDRPRGGRRGTRHGGCRPPGRAAERLVNRRDASGGARGSGRRPYPRRSWRGGGPGDRPGPARGGAAQPRHHRVGPRGRYRPLAPVVAGIRAAARPRWAAAIPGGVRVGGAAAVARDAVGPLRYVRLHETVGGAE